MRFQELFQQFVQFDQLGEPERADWLAALDQEIGVIRQDAEAENDEDIIQALAFKLQILQKIDQKTYQIAQRLIPLCPPDNKNAQLWLQAFAHAKQHPVVAAQTPTLDDMPSYQLPTSWSKQVESDCGCNSVSRSPEQADYDDFCRELGKQPYLFGLTPLQDQLPHHNQLYDEVAKTQYPTAVQYAKAAASNDANLTKRLLTRAHVLASLGNEPIRALTRKNFDTIVAFVRDNKASFIIKEPKELDKELSPVNYSIFPNSQQLSIQLIPAQPGVCYMRVVVPYTNIFLGTLGPVVSLEDSQPFFYHESIIEITGDGEKILSDRIYPTHEMAYKLLNIKPNQAIKQMPATRSIPKDHKDYLQSLANEIQDLFNESDDFENVLKRIPKKLDQQAFEMLATKVAKSLLANFSFAQVSDAIKTTFEITLRDDVEPKFRQFFHDYVVSHAYDIHETKTRAAMQAFDAQSANTAAPTTEESTADKPAATAPAAATTTSTDSSPAGSTRFFSATRLTSMPKSSLTPRQQHEKQTRQDVAKEFILMVKTNIEQTNWKVGKLRFKNDTITTKGIRKKVPHNVAEIYQLCQQAFLQGSLGVACEESETSATTQVNYVAIFNAIATRGRKAASQRFTFGRDTATQAFYQNFERSFAEKQQVIAAIGAS